MKPPPDVFSLPVILCPSCGHGIDPHGVDPGGYCGVGEWNDELGINMTCTCQWQPNDIAATLLADERERIARTIEMDDPFAADGEGRDFEMGWQAAHQSAARIARGSELGGEGSE